MDFTLSPENRRIRDTVSTFVDEEIVPRAAAIDETDEFPADLVDQMADLGLLGVPFPEEYGGAGLDYHGYVTGLIEIARGSGGLGTVVAARELPRGQAPRLPTSTTRFASTASR